MSFLLIIIIIITIIIISNMCPSKSDHFEHMHYVFLDF